MANNAGGTSRYRYVSLLRGDEESALLGKGAFGTVLVAWDCRDSKLVAMKKDKVASEETVREMMFFQILPPHPNLLEMYGHYVAGDHLYLVFQYLALSLHDVWKRAHGVIDWGLADRYGNHCMAGLRFLHHHEVAHLNLNMTNILFDASTNDVRIADLGFAAACGTNMLLKRAVTTLCYSAPEVALGIRQQPCKQDALDLWSAGCILGALWCGSNLFDASTPAELFAQQVDLLGCPSISWPAVLQAPSWSECAGPDLLGKRPKGPQALCDPSVVRRMMHGHEHAIDLVFRLLAWNPADRPSAENAYRHEAWSALQNSSSSDTLSAAPPPSATIPDTGGVFAPDVLAAPGGSPCTSLPSKASAPAEGAAVARHAVATLPVEAADTACSGTCKCSGNCGNVACARAKSLFYYYKAKGVISPSRGFCQHPPLPGATLCLTCLCEYPECERGRVRGRWCVAHEKQFGQLRLGPGQYLNFQGVCNEAAGWCWELRVVARHGWMLNMLSPSDMRAFLRCADVVVGSARILTGHALLQLWVAAFLTWPAAVDAWVTALQSKAGAWTAKRYSEAGLALPANLEDEEMHGQRFGPNTLMSKLGGQASKWQTLVDLAEEFEPIGLPQTTDEARQFIVKINAWSTRCRFPATYGHGAPGVLAGAPDPMEGYVRTRVVHQVLLWVSGRTGPHIWDCMTVDELRMWIPDPYNLCNSLSPSSTLQEIECTFSVHPFMVSCWASLLHHVQRKWRSAFEQPSWALWQLACRLRTADGSLEGNLNTLAEHFCQAQTEPGPPEAEKSRGKRPAATATPSLTSAGRTRRVCQRRGDTAS